MRPLYLYRIDDVTPEMDGDAFRRLLDLFLTHAVVPLLGVVPDNRDPVLAAGPPDPRLWDLLRDLVAAGKVEIAQHGTHHAYRSARHGLLGRRYGIQGGGEFVGIPWEEQRRLIAEGRDLLRRRGLPTDVFMAPGHGFDRGTLRALGELGFRSVTDGIALWPYRAHGLTFVPQQLWAPRRVPFGVWTVCLHPATTGPALLAEVEAHLESGDRIGRFGDVVDAAAPGYAPVADALFRGAFMLHVLRHRARAART